MYIHGIISIGKLEEYLEIFPIEKKKHLANKHDYIISICVRGIHTYIYAKVVQIHCHYINIIAIQYLEKTAAICFFMYMHVYTRIYPLYVIVNRSS